MYWGTAPAPAGLGRDVSPKEVSRFFSTACNTLLSFTAFRATEAAEKVGGALIAAVASAFEDDELGAESDNEEEFDPL